MNVCLYGKTCAAFVEPVARGMQRAGEGIEAPIAPLAIEDALADLPQCREVTGVYVLPFDVPPSRLPESPEELVRAVCPRARIFNEIGVHELCRDAGEWTRRVLSRGVPMPDTVITESADEVRSFVDEHDYAILKRPGSCGGLGDLVVCSEAGGALVGESGGGRRYVLELGSSGTRCRVEDGVLSLAGPFYVQRLVVEVGRRGRVAAAQILRAYLADGQVVCWIERQRQSAARPGDFIVTPAFGARYRFVREVRQAAQTAALRTAEILGIRFGYVDLAQTGTEGPFPVAVGTDGPEMFVDRGFKELPEFRASHDLDRYLVEALATPGEEAPARGVRYGDDHRTGPGRAGGQTPRR